MAVTAAQLDNFLDASECVLVEIVKADGSTPREKGAWILVGTDQILGTIGGGQLEYVAIDTARQMLRSGTPERDLDVPLGPEIGQCCGGRVQLTLCLMTPKLSQALKNRIDLEIQNCPHIYIMGAGHVGQALAHALSLLPFKTIVVDTRHEALVELPKNVEARLTVLPEAEVRAAPPASAFVVLTHDHAMDFMITGEALMRGDASYVGMIGSKTKRAVFLSYMKEQGATKAHILPLICPMGGENSSDKRPEVIAALVAAEILVHTGQSQKFRSQSYEGDAHILEGIYAK